MGYALRLAETGRPNESLTANTEAVKLLRVLVRERPLAYGVELATALSNRSGRWPSSETCAKYWPTAAKPSMSFPPQSGHLA